MAFQSKSSALTEVSGEKMKGRRFVGVETSPEEAEEAGLWARRGVEDSEAAAEEEEEERGSEMTWRETTLGRDCEDVEMAAAATTTVDDDDDDAVARACSRSDQKALYSVAAKYSRIKREV